VRLFGPSLLLVPLAALACAPPAPPSAVEAPRPEVQEAASSTLPKGAVLRFGTDGLAHPWAVDFVFAGERLVSWGPRVGAEGDVVRIFDWRADALTSGYGLAAVRGASVGGKYLFGPSESGLRVFEAETGLPRWSVAIDSWGYEAALSPDGERAASLDQSLALVLHSRKGSRRLAAKAHEDTLTAIAFHPSGQRILTASFDDWVKLWDAESGAMLHGFDLRRDVGGAAFSADGKRMIAHTEDTATVWDVAMGAEVARLGGDSQPMFLRGGAAISPDGSRVALGEAAGEGAVILFDLDPVRVRWQVNDVHADRLAFSPDGSSLVTLGAYDRTFRRILVDDGKLVPAQRLQGSVALSVHQGTAYMADATGRIAAFELEHGAGIGELIAHDRKVEALAISADGERLASGDVEGTVIIWNRRERRAEKRLLTAAPVRSLAFVGNQILVAPERGVASFWEIETGRQTARLPKGSLAPISATRDGALVATVEAAGVWVGRPGEATGKHFPTTGRPTAVALSPDGRWLAAADDRVHRWETATGRSIGVMSSNDNEVSMLTWSSRGELAFTDGEEITLVGPDGQTARRLSGHGGAEVRGLAFLDDGRLVSAGDDGLGLVWEAAPSPARELPPASSIADATATTDAETRCGPVTTDLHGDALPPCAMQRHGSLRFHHPTTLRRLAFSADGRYLAGAGGTFDDGWVSVWDGTGAVVVKFPTRGDVGSLAFHPTEARLFARSGGRLLSWSLESDLAARSVSVGASDYNTMALSPSGALVSIGDRFGRVQIYDAATFALKSQFVVGANQIGRLGFIDDETLIAKTTALEVSRWRWADGKKLADVSGELFHLTVMPDGTVLGGDDGVLRAGRVGAIAPTRVAFEDDDRLAFAPRGIVAIHRSEYEEEGRVIPARVELYELASGRRLADLATGPADEIALDPAGARLALARGMRVELWDVKARKRIDTPPAHRSWVGGVGFAAGGERLVTIDRHVGINIWNRHTGALIEHRSEPDLEHGHVTPDGAFIAGSTSTSLGGQALHLWPVRGGAPTVKKVSLVSLDPMAISADGGRLANPLPLKRAIEVLELPSLKPLKEWRIVGEDVESLAFGPQGELAVSTMDLTAIYDAASGEALAVIAEGGGVAFTPDGRLVMATGSDLRFYRAPTFEQERIVPVATGFGFDIVVSPKGWLALAADHGRIEIRASDDGRLLGHLRGHDGRIDRLSVAPDGWHLASGSWDGTAIVWHVEPLTK
jgi:WD40 repeat protein